MASDTLKAYDLVNTSSMASNTPRYLYRAYSDTSNGWNTDKYLASQFTLRDFNASTIKLHGLCFDKTERNNNTMPKVPRSKDNPSYVPPQPLMLNAKPQLILALQRKLVADNAFIFFTSSFPQVLSHAIYKNRKEPNVRIICLDTWTATTAKGLKVAFYPIKDIRELMGINLTDGHVFEPLDFEDVWLTTDIVIPGSGSTAVSFLTLLDSGFCKCVPEIGVIKSTGAAGVAAPIRVLREYWFNQEYKKTITLMDKHFNLAAKLAAAFEPVIRSESANLVPMHIFAWFVSMMDPDGDNNETLEWLSRYGNSNVENPYTSDDSPEEPAWLKEVEAFDSIMAALRG